MYILNYRGMSYDFLNIEEYILCSALVASRKLGSTLHQEIKDDLDSFIGANTDYSASKPRRKLMKTLHPDKFRFLRDLNKIREELLLDPQVAFEFDRLSANPEMYAADSIDGRFANFLSNEMCAMINGIVSSFDSPYSQGVRAKLGSFTRDFADHDPLLFPATIQRLVLSKIKTGDPIFDNIGVPAPFINNPESFAELIQKLEQEQTPLAYLCCAMLLSNDIVGFYDNKDDDAAAEEYFIKRYSDALGFYMLAAKEPELLPAVKHILALQLLWLPSDLITDREMRTRDQQISSKLSACIDYLCKCRNKVEARPVMIRSYNIFKDESKFDIFARLNMQVYANQEQLAIVKSSPKLEHKH